MKKTIFAKSLIAVAALASALFTGCQKKDAPEGNNKKELTYSRSAGPYSVLFEEAVQPILEAKGYSIKGFDYSNLSLADDALNGGDVDFNVEQHSAYASSWNKGNGGDLTVLTPIPTVPAGLFSAKYKALEPVSGLENPKVAVPNDPSNTARAYALLQKIGWITLKDGTDLSLATNADIAENPYNIEFTEMSSANIPLVLDDFDYAVITGSIVYNAGIDPSSAIAQETVLPHLLLQLTVKEANKDSQWAKDIVAAYHSKELKEYLDKNNNGLWYIPEGYFND
ncbi:MetQ/NlpA family ABC transporter substrate-binding protein [Treponema zioleckii]|uniref:MetQ/NlpA family ABC transporter substrate-binding protein n=1 Tax=Treponema zioleckii TaxID=331680 RepID=UPI00168A9D21|nr:MetQ/NlpA family ABC transporter substrate-binding protein [Treponema zioleckii]